jgi:hypothetical protein
MQPEMSPETRALYEYLAEKQPEIFTYEEAFAASGINDLSRLRGAIYTCLRRLKKTFGIWYIVQRGVGYARVTEEQKNLVQHERIERLRAGAGRADRDQDTIATNELSPAGQMRHALNTTRIHLIRTATSTKTRRALERQISNGTLPLPEPRAGRKAVPEKPADTDPTKWLMSGQWPFGKK